MRSKEEAHDYRYFPDPDLTALVVSPELRTAAAADMPELPAARRDRYVAELGIPEADAHRLTVEPEIADYFEAVLLACGSARPAANWVLSELIGRLNADGRSIADAPLPAPRLGGLVRLVQDGTISGRAAKDVFDEAYRTGAEPAEIVERRGLRQVTDRLAVADACRAVIEAFPGQVAEYRGGKTPVLAFLVGQVMKRTKGAAKPELVGEVLRGLLA